MNNQVKLTLLLLTMVPAAAFAELDLLDGGWRLSAGAVYDSGVKTDFRFMPQQTYETPYAVAPGALTKREAEAKGGGTKVGSRTYYENSNGAKSWIDTEDGAIGHDLGKLGYYSLAKDAWNGDRSFTLADAKYEELYVNQTYFAAQEQRDRDESAMPGLNLQLSRNIYHDDDNDWGLEIAVGVTYERCNRAVKTGGSWMTGESRKRSGSYTTTYVDNGMLGDIITAGSELLDSIYWRNDVNGQTVIGQTSESSSDVTALIDLEGVESEWGAEKQEQNVEYGSLYARGDYDNLDIMLLLQPYYDVCDWFSINATIGIVCSRQSMDMTVAMYRNGAQEYRREHDYDQWDVYGLAGLGVMFYYDGWTLSGDFLARFLDDELEVNDRYYRGKVSRGNWMFRLGVGYEF